MADEPLTPIGKTDEEKSSANTNASPRSADEAKVWAVLEQARQNVKPIVKEESQGEIVSTDLLNLRLKRVSV